MAKFKFSGGAKTENTQSAKKWLNFNFRGGGGYSAKSKSKLKVLCSESGALSEF